MTNVIKFPSKVSPKPIRVETENMLQPDVVWDTIIVCDGAAFSVTNHESYSGYRPVLNINNASRFTEQRAEEIAGCLRRKTFRNFITMNINAYVDLVRKLQNETDIGLQ